MRKSRASKVKQARLVEHFVAGATARCAAALEAEIDQMVYELYGLTEEEIQIIEENVN